MSAPDPLTALTGAATPPQANGEAMFEAPWQGRLFGMAVALNEAGLFEWADFQARLIHHIGVWDRAHSNPTPAGTAAAPYAYYEHFGAALNDLVTRTTPLTAAEFDARVREYRARPHGHDHDHDHDH
ncbi:MAG: nitrile hydratase accessory protein [Pseudomonadota bacterium]